ncbi:MAG: prephenate dehydrogenase [Christensenellales bacterium]|jgi:prephenate dehydrogenase
MKIGVVGLGLIGGSLAKAYTRAGYDVFGEDIDKATEDYAIMSHACARHLEGNISECDCIFIALYPQATVDFLEKNAGKIKRGSLVADCCGVKRILCERCFAIARDYGFHFIGAHPMAGIQYSGFKYSRADMFDGATMLIVPRPAEDMAVIGRLNDVLKTAGFASVTTTSAEEHDRIIAFTSQLAHVVSNAYIKSPTAERHHRFSAGSYRDLTRVAKLSEDMWSELFIDNADNLAFELDVIIASLSEYRDAIRAGEREKLRGLLRDGREKKEAIDTEWRQQ